MQLKLYAALYRIYSIHRNIQRKGLPNTNAKFGRRWKFLHTSAPLCHMLESLKFRPENQWLKIKFCLVSCHALFAIFRASCQSSRLKAFRFGKSCKQNVEYCFENFHSASQACGSFYEATVNHRIMFRWAFDCDSTTSDDKLSKHECRGVPCSQNRLHGMEL